MGYKEISIDQRVILVIKSYIIGNYMIEEILHCTSGGEEYAMCALLLLGALLCSFDIEFRALCGLLARLVGE